jgi:glycolate oxidase
MVLNSDREVQREPVTDPAILEGYRHDASPLEGSPEGLFRPSSAEEAADQLHLAADRGVAVTPCGLRSSTTGAGLAAHGWVMSCEKLGGWDVDVERRTATVGAGAVLRDFKDAVEEQGLFYPPDPTSERECTLAGTVACDASGARTYRYGATHRWVTGVEVALPDGSLRWFRRRSVDKDAAGYAGLRDLVGVICGSEGTLGFITKVEVRLIERPLAYTGGLAFFADVAAALAFVGLAREQDRRGTGVRPRCLELLDAGCLQIMRGQGSGVALPAAAGAAIYFEEEHAPDADEAVLLSWWTALESAPGALPDDTVVATDPARQDELRRLRHAVPATLNEEGRAHAGAGGRKISTDWAVPFDRLAPLVETFDGWLADAGIDRALRYGHVGNGHPHYNLIVKDPAERARAETVVHRMCEAACAVGGTITAEHGIGKIKRPYVPYRFTPLELAAMRAVKSVFDPAGMMAPGNLFPDA